MTRGPVGANSLGMIASSSNRGLAPRGQRRGWHWGGSARCPTGQEKRSAFLARFQKGFPWISANPSGSL
eukprot:625189-Pyramimonas_sp.AAC.1